MKFESFNAHESAEGKKERAERLAEERNGLFSRVVDRALNYGTLGIRDQFRDRYKNGEEMGDTEKKVLELAKKVPVLGHYLNSFEGMVGVDLETGEEISSKDSLVRTAVGTVGIGLDVVRIIKPDFKFPGQTLEHIEKWTEQAQSSDPESMSSRALGAIRDFLKTNEDTVQGFEEHLERSIDEKNYVK